ncbi:MAG: DNA alkylation repair protein [Vicinamibacterales bacterium]
MRAITAKGTPGAAAVYRRHGVAEPTVGLRYADIGALVKRIGVDHDLALALWDTGLHDARVVATKVADPLQLTRATLDRWLADCANYIVTDAVAGTAARTPDAPALAQRWLKARGEWASAAGWTVVSLLAMDGRLPEAAAAALLDRIARGIHRAPNRTRYAMNGALIAIGGAMPGLRARATAVARAIGVVEVDHGETGCKTPDACTMIDAMANHRAARRTRVTGARLAGSARPRGGGARRRR